MLTHISHTLFKELRQIKILPYCGRSSCHFIFIQVHMKGGKRVNPNTTLDKLGARGWCRRREKNWLTHRSSRCRCRRRGLPSSRRNAFSTRSSSWIGWLVGRVVFAYAALKMRQPASSWNAFPPSFFFLARASKKGRPVEQFSHYSWISAGLVWWCREREVIASGSEKKRAISSFCTK